MFGAFLGAISQGVLWGIMVLGVYITFKLLDIPDMTVDGSFTLGGFICAILISDGKINPILVLICAILGGLIAGAVTGILHTVFEIPAILAGILTQISLWSINLRIAHKRSNITLPKLGNIFSAVASMTGMKKSQVALVLGIIIVIVIIALLYWFFGTEMGSALRATGNNEAMVRALGINAKTMKLIALMISNGLVALAGALVCQSQGYADINMGTGAIVIGLAAIVIGEVLLGWVKPFYAKLGAAVIGSVVYFIIRAIVLQMGLDSDYMKVLSAIIVAVALSFPVLSKNIVRKRIMISWGRRRVDVND